MMKCLRTAGLPLTLIGLLLAQASFAQKKLDANVEPTLANRTYGRYQLFNGEFAIGDNRFMKEIILIDSDTGQTWVYRVNLGPQKESGWIQMHVFVPQPPASSPQP